MALGFFKNIFDKKVSLDQTEYVAEKISVAIVAFEDDCITNSGKVLSEYLKEIKELSICYFDEPINKKFLDLQSRNFFDFIDCLVLILLLLKCLSLFVVLDFFVSYIFI